jgi:hypothetical protein
MRDFTVEEDGASSLDLFSTSPTLLRTCAVSFERCPNGAPFFAFKRAGGRYGVVQGSCNSWTCPRCGVLVAKSHYGRIVEGARELAKGGDLYFITITCRGSDVTVEDATAHYLAWTSKFLDACYAKAKRAGERWAYVQVTEKQKRGHPHSHVLTTFQPSDIIDGYKFDWKRDNTGQLQRVSLPVLRSEWLKKQVVRSGLGDQYDISKVRTVEGAARYVAKYMFKKSQFEAYYPKHWKRVRYSQSFPKLAKVKSDAFVLLSADDWHHLATLALIVDAPRGDAYDAAKFFMRGNDVILIERKEENVSNDRK